MNKHILLALPILMISCAGADSTDSDLDTNTLSVIAPPLEGDFQNDTVFRLDPKIENTFETPNGSSISVPANSMVDKEGNLVTEPVDLSFTQYHSAADIIASGIPMTYDSAGTKYNFESAGMFTLDAKANNRPVYIKEGEQLTVNLASDKDENFNFYELDEGTGDWTYERSPEPTLHNPVYDRTIEPLQPEKTEKGAFVIDLNLDRSDFGELDAFSGIVWEYVGEDDSLDPRQNGWVQKTKWTDFNLEPTYEKGFEYYLTMKNSSKKFVTKVKAALSEEEYETAMADFVAKRTALATKRDQMQKPYIRSVQIAGFGTYNYDYYHQMKEPAKILADFEFIGQEEDKSNALVFVVYPSSQVTVKYPQNNWDKFALDKTKDPKLMAIMPNNKIAVYEDDISRSYGHDNYTYKLKVLDQDVTKKGELETIIAEL